MDHNYYSRRSFRIIAETCPTVRTKINELLHGRQLPIDLADDIMRIVSEFGTTPLREAHIDQIETAQEFEDQLETARDQLTETQKQNE